MLLRTVQFHPDPPHNADRSAKPPANAQAKPGVKSDQDNPDAPTGISAAAIQGAMKSHPHRPEEEKPIRSEPDPQQIEDDDPEWRRAGGKSDSSQG